MVTLRLMLMLGLVMCIPASHGGLEWDRKALWPCYSVTAVDEHPELWWVCPVRLFKLYIWYCRKSPLWSLRVKTNAYNQEPSVWRSSVLGTDAKDLHNVIKPTTVSTDVKRVLQEVGWTLCI